MRLRDLRWYILASIIIIISYAGIAFSYYASIENGKILKSMEEISYQATISSKELIDDKLNEIASLYIADTNDSLVTNSNLGFEKTTNTQQFVQSNFDKRSADNSSYIYARMYDIEGKVNETAKADMTFYFYFIKESEGANSYRGRLVSKIKAETLFNDLKLKNKMVVFEKKPTSVGKVTNTNIIAKDDDGNLNKDYPIMVGKEMPLNIVSYEGNEVNISYDLAGEPSILTGVEFMSDYTFALIIPTSDPLLGISWVKTQAWVFFVATVLVSIAMLVLLVLGCRRASKLLRADRHAVEATMSVVIRIDLKGNVIFTNKTFKKMYGSSKLLDISGFIDVETEEPIMRSIKNNKSFECMVEVDGVKHYLHLSPLYISRSYYLMGNEITIDYKARKHLEIMSGKNENTHCENGFMLANQFEKIIESNAGYDLAFIEYNIYKYDELISIFGRTSYVELLNQYLDVLRNNYQDIGIYHMTDSKFIVVLPNKSIDEVTIRVNETMREFKKPILVRENSIYVKTKVVVYNLTQDIIEDANLEDIKTKLDLAYRNMAQLSSKDFIVYDPVMDSVILAADVMEHDIEIGLENDEFEMYLQPQFDMVSKKIAGFEALIRWNNPKYKDKSPQAFIELAEQRGHMLDIGKFVVRESFKLAKKLEVYKVSVSVNISPVQLLQVGFVQSLIDEADSLELNPATIAIEITETLLMENFQLVNEKLKLLKAKGFTIHLDDFCTGYSSMQYLRDFPVDTIKIDKGFTMYIETSKVHETICRTICNLAQALDLGIVCEGVENEAQAEIIKKMGCRIIQGFLIGKAMPYDDAVALIEKYKR